MKAIKRIFYVLAGIVLLLWVTGNNHIYLGLYDTYLQGRTKPAVDDPDLFPTRDILAENPHPWPVKLVPNAALLEETQKTNKELGTLALLVIRKDTIIFEQYYENYQASTLSNSFSMAKTFLSVLTGVAVKEGKIHLTDPVRKYLPEYVGQADTALKVLHLLNMTSGMNFDESYGNPFGFMAKAYYGTDIKSLLKGYHLEKTPGTEWEYLGGNNLLLSLLLEKVLGQKVSDYATQKIWNPAGMEYNAKWILDHEGGEEKTFSGLYATARDFGKIGQLYMNKGTANGVSIVDEHYVHESIRPVLVPDTEGKITDTYGYAWWLTQYKGHQVFYMQGILGQYVLCIPDQDLIIVRLGRNRAEKSNGINPDDLFVWLEEGLHLGSK